MVSWLLLRTMAYLSLRMWLWLALMMMLLLCILVRHLLPSGNLTWRWGSAASNCCCRYSTHPGLLHIVRDKPVSQKVHPRRLVEDYLPPTPNPRVSNFLQAL